jgi:hypothetical protein
MAARCEFVILSAAKDLAKMIAASQILRYAQDDKLERIISIRPPLERYNLKYLYEEIKTWSN